MLNVFQRLDDKQYVIAYYIGSYSVLYDCIFDDQDVDALIKLIKIGTNRKDLLSTSREEFDKDISTSLLYQ